MEDLVPRSGKASFPERGSAVSQYPLADQNGTNDYTTYWYESEDAATADTSSDHSGAKQYLRIGINSAANLSVQSAMGTSTLTKK